MEHSPPPFFKRGPAPLVRLFFFASLSLALLVIDARFRYAEGLRSWLALAAYPIQRVATAPIDMLGAVGSFFSTQAQLVEENARLRSKAMAYSHDAQRFEAMLKLGLIDEVKALRKKYRLNAALPSMRAVGYRQVWEYLEGSIDRDTMREKAIAATRQLAKHQLTWLRSFPDLVRLDAGGAQDASVALHLLLDEGGQLARG